MDGVTDSRLKRLRFHDLRHTFVTLAVQAFPLTDVKSWMGHADIQTTMLYIHSVPQDDAAERLGLSAAKAALEQNFVADPPRITGKDGH